MAPWLECTFIVVCQARRIGVAKSGACALNGLKFHDFHFSQRFTEIRVLIHIGPFLLNFYIKFHDFHFRCNIIKF